MAVSNRVRPTPAQTCAAGVRNVDFACGYEIATAPDDTRSSEEWARAAWEDAPASLRWFMLAGWRLVLGLRLGPRPSPDHILGWRILESSHEQTVCDARSAFLSATNIFRLVDGHLVWSTVVVYQRLIARLIWPPVSLVHRLVVRITLHRAAQRP